MGEFHLKGICHGRNNVEVVQVVNCNLGFRHSVVRDEGGCFVGASVPVGNQYLKNESCQNVTCHG